MEISKGEKKTKPTKLGPVSLDRMKPPEIPEVSGHIFNLENFHSPKHPCHKRTFFTFLKSSTQTSAALRHKTQQGLL